MPNKTLHKAKVQKNDEFYTQLPDIENELKHYKEQLKDKIVFCNCDDPHCDFRKKCDWNNILFSPCQNCDEKMSNFWKYFVINFKYLGLKKVIATHFGKNSYKLEYDGINKPVKAKLKKDGDFRSPECIELLKKADIVITNPPFSLFREYVAQLMEYNKQILIIGNDNAIAYKGIFKLIKDNKIWRGYNKVKKFVQPDGSIKQFGNVGWFTNLDVNKRHEKLTLYEKYDPIKYPKYDNYDAIEVSKVAEIPCDYDAAMGVPATFIDKCNPEQFEILGQTGIDIIIQKGRPYINGKRLYTRILIKKRKLT
ncbi:MAG: adenine-specific methyltransferase EcoRI family protein [Endomicrobium sp.]|jgi:hypothetical protein|nr:adenine-specific methyltransferase EcoRI family protein [Endomicrobium sp.]